MPVITIVGFVDTTPFTFIQYIQGAVYGHPRFPDGSYVRVGQVDWDPRISGWRSASGKIYRVVDVPPASEGAE